MQGTGFPHAERERLGVRGLLPPGTLSMERQVGTLHDMTPKSDSYYKTQQVPAFALSNISISNWMQSYISQVISCQCGHV